MGSSGKTDTRSVLPSLQCWQGWSGAVGVAGSDLSMHTSCHCRYTFLKALGGVARVHGPHLPLSECSRLNSASPQYHLTFPLEYRFRSVSIISRACITRRWLGLFSQAADRPPAPATSEWLHLSSKEKIMNTGAKWRWRQGPKNGYKTAASL